MISNKFMKGDFPDDIFTENDVLACLEAAGLEHGRGGGRYILSQCPLHEDKNPSAQIYTDDWFVKCHAGCEGGRFHITKAFPQLRDKGLQPHTAPQRTRRAEVVKYKTFDLMEEWKDKDVINDDFKTIPAEILFNMGWRKEKNGDYFIPYFNMTKTQIPFCQYRHMSGNRRFSMLKDARPIAYGLWNLDNSKIFIVEGTSDCAVLEYAAVPYIGMPSASSGELIKGLAQYCKQNGIQLIYAGDNDSAGDKLRDALDEVAAYRVCQPPKKHKDWGDFLEAEGIEAVQDWAARELLPPKIELEHHPNGVLEQVQKIIPGAEQLKIVGSSESKEQPLEPTLLF